LAQLALLFRVQVDAVWAWFEPIGRKQPMRFAEACFTEVRAGHLFRKLISGALCLILAGQPAFGAGTKKKPTTPAEHLEGRQRTLHALNRLTFGPRPSDVEAAEKMGLEHWFERQLDPASIDDSALEARLAMFPAMKLEQAELMRRYPNPAILQIISQRNLPLPADPVEHAIYKDSMAFYEMARAKQQALQSASTDSKNDMMKSSSEAATALPGDSVDPSTPAMTAHEEQFYSGLDAVRIINLSPDARMQRILAMSPEELMAFRKGLNPMEMVAVMEGLTPEQKETLAALQGPARMVSMEVLQSRLLRDIYSERQLEAVMTDFWLNHFNVYLRKNQNEPYYLPSYERDTIRPQALGKFEDLLVATAKSPAMLTYLDNVQSIGPDSPAAKQVAQLKAQRPDAKLANVLPQGLNENYARELMELHTLGVNGGYTQADVTQVAKVFTGWTVDQPFRGGSFQFNERRHEPGPKVVLGKTIPEGGEAEGLAVLHMLATSPATARFISTKLAVRFVSDTPPPALVDRMAKAFLDSGGDIKVVLRTMFQSPEFWSTEVYRAKVKTPVEFLVSAVRASGADVANAQPLVGALDKLGMPIYGMQTPNGYSWTSEPWVSTGALVNRMNFAVALSNNRLFGVRTDWTELLEGVLPSAGSNDVASKEAVLETLLLGVPANEQTRKTVLAQLGDETMQQQAEKSFGIRSTEQEPMWSILNVGATPGPARAPMDRQAAEIGGLLLGSPEFQRR
jgi:uncharacterized protein (DUF1800 family)